MSAHLIIKLWCLFSLASIVSSCAVLTPREEPTSAKLQTHVASHKSPTWASERITPQWWQVYGDNGLNQDIACTLENSPTLQVISARLEAADAQVAVAKAAALPSLNLGYGFRFGRAKEPDFGPYDLKPWTGSANLSWELDIFRKLARARESAEFSRRAIFWELSAAKLLLTSRIAEARFRLYRFDQEIVVISEAVRANGQILNVLRDREQAGLIAETEIHRMVAEDQKLKRSRDELARQRYLAEIELETLKGGHERNGNTQGKLPTLPPVPERAFCDLLQCHPSILAAESRVRSAFRLEENSRLNLLPSFTLKGRLMGASPHFFLDQFGVWRREIGPMLDIPIYDPNRLATLKVRRSQTNEAAALYRSSLVQVVGEIDAAYINLSNRKKQLTSICREVDALAAARHNVSANFREGLLSQVEVLESERSYLQAARIKVALQEAVIRDHVALIRALGGGCTDQTSAPKIVAQPVY